MTRSRTRSRLAPLGAVLVVVALALPASGGSIDPTKASLPAGWRVTQPGELEAAEVRGIAERLGVELSRIRNTAVSINGFAAQVNWLLAPDEDAAKAVEAALVRLRGADFAARQGREVIEVVGTNVLLARTVLAALGLREGAEATYEVKARIGLVDEGDDDHANDVFVAFLEREKDPSRAAEIDRRIQETVKGWTFGRTLCLAASDPGWITASWSFEPEPTSRKRVGDQEVVTFEDPPTELGIPYVDAEARITVRARFEPSRPGLPADAKALLAPTPRWPVDADAVRAVVAGTRAKTTAKDDESLVLGLLRHVSQSIRYDGPLGSRHGVLAVLDQGFGRCWDKSDVLVTLARAAGVPAREVAGWVPPIGQGHVWTEVRLGDRGWVPVDATATWLGTSEDYVPFFVTDDGAMPILYLAMPTVRRVE